MTFSAIPEMISTHCVEKLTHCKAVSSPLNDSLSISHLTSEKNCISLIDSLVFGHLNIVLCLEGRPILLVVFRMHEFWKRRRENFVKQGKNCLFEAQMSEKPVKNSIRALVKIISVVDFSITRY